MEAGEHEAMTKALPEIDEPDAIKCPSCGYDLRGQPGDALVCPECGTSGPAARFREITALGSGRWPKEHALVIAPAGWMMIGGAVVFSVAIAELSARRVLVIAPFLAFTAVAGWARAMGRLHDLLPGGRALRLALLGHLAAIGGIAGVFAAIAGLFTLPFGFVLIATGLGLILLGGRIERFIARQCIAHRGGEPG